MARPCQEISWVVEVTFRMALRMLYPSGRIYPTRRLISSVRYCVERGCWSWERMRIIVLATSCCRPMNFPHGWSGLKRPSTLGLIPAIRRMKREMSSCGHLFSASLRWLRAPRNLFGALGLVGSRQMGRYVSDDETDVVVSRDGGWCDDVASGAHDRRMLRFRVAEFDERLDR